MKKALSLAVSLTLFALLFALCFTAAAEEEPAVSIAGSGTEENPFLIGTLEELIFFRDTVNAGEDCSGLYIALTADIDLSSVASWEPIGKNNSLSFAGHFDGKGHTVSHLSIATDDATCSGLFGYTSPAATITGLTLAEVDINAKERVGAVCGVSLGVIADCTVTGSVRGTIMVGGITGSSQGTVRACVNECTVTGESSVGGIMGTADCGTAENCINRGAVDGSGAFVGGIVGRVENYAMISGSTNCGSITAGGANVTFFFNSNDSADIMHLSAAGGIVGGGAYTIISDCKNTGSVTGEGAACGGIAGILGRDLGVPSISSSVNEGEITAGTGLIPGGDYIDEKGRWINRSYTAVSGAGGICGINSEGIENCLNTGKVSGKKTQTILYEYYYEGDSLVPYDEGWVAVPDEALEALPTSGGICGITGTYEWLIDEGDVVSNVNACLGVGEVGEYASPGVGLDILAVNSGGEVAGASHNFYLAEEAGEDGARTAEQLASGLVAYELTAVSGGAWGQSLGEDGIPVLGASPVFRDTATGEYTNTLTVYFETNGGEAIAPLTGLGHGETLPAITPEREGEQYVFLGWYRDAALTEPWDLATDTVTDGMTLYAAWEEYHLAITRGEETFYFDDLVIAIKDCAEDGDIIRVLCDYTDTVPFSQYSIPDGPTKSITIDLAGHTVAFEAGLGILFFENGYHLTLTGKGQIDAAFLMRGGSITVESGTVKAVAALTPATATLKGGRFAGLTEAERDALLASGNEMLTVLGLLFDTRGFTYGFADTEEGAITATTACLGALRAFSAEVTAIDLSAEASTVMGGGIYIFGGLPGGTEILPRYTVSFDTAGIVTPPDAQVVTHGMTVNEPPLLSVTGYILLGWYADAEYTTPFDMTTPITGDLTLYARYSDYAADIDGVYGALERAEQELAEAIENGEALSDKIAALDTALREAESTLTTADGAQRTELLGAIATGDATLAAAIDKVKEDLATTKQELAEAIENGEALSDKIAALDAALREAESTLTTADGAQRTELLGAIATGDATLAAAIDEVKKDLDEARAELERAIAAGDAALGAEITALYAALEEVSRVAGVTEAEELKAELNGNLLAAKTELLRAIELGDERNAEQLAEEIARLEERLVEFGKETTEGALVLAAVGALAGFLVLLFFGLAWSRRY